MAPAKRRGLLYFLSSVRFRPIFRCALSCGKYGNCWKNNQRWHQSHSVPFFPGFFPGDLNLNVVAMALSGYTDERPSLWREMCSSLRLQLKNPYLCVMFAFLTSEPGSYDGVLVPRNVPGFTATTGSDKHTHTCTRWLCLCFSTRAVWL